MKRLVVLVLVSLMMIGAFAVPTWNAKNVDFAKYEVKSENEMTYEQADNLLKLISLDTPYFEQLLEKGYYDVTFDTGDNGVWFMFVNDGKILSFQAVLCEDIDQFVFVLKEWKVK